MSNRVPWADAQNQVRHWSIMDKRDVTDTDSGEHAGRFSGHAAMFGQRTWIGGKSWGWWEQIERGAFSVSLRNNNDIKFVRSHDPDKVLASIGGGSLRLAEDEVGLAVDADIANTQDGRDLVVLLGRGDLNKMSFAFEPIKWRTEELDDGKTLYSLTEVRLFEVSVVAFPAYDQTDAGLRAAAFEDLCRRGGLEAGRVGQLIERLRNPDGDEQIDSAVRAMLADPTTADPAATSQQSDPAETSRTGIHPLALRTLLQRTEMQGASQ